MSQSFTTPFAIPVLAQAPSIAGGKGDASPAPTSGTLLPSAGNGGPLGPSGTPTGAGAPAAPGYGMFLPLILVFVFMIGLSWWTQSKERKKRTAMMSQLARSDRVVTSGGMIGTITDIRDDEVVLRVDDSTNTKITFSKSAVQGVLKKSAAA